MDKENEGEGERVGGKSGGDESTKKLQQAGY